MQHIPPLSKVFCSMRCSSQHCQSCQIANGHTNATKFPSVHSATPPFAPPLQCPASSWPISPPGEFHAPERYSPQRTLLLSHMALMSQREMNLSRKFCPFPPHGSTWLECDQGEARGGPGPPPHAPCYKFTSVNISSRVSDLSIFA